jgi:hypothetical protein
MDEKLFPVHSLSIHSSIHPFRWCLLDKRGALLGRSLRGYGAHSLAAPPTQQQRTQASRFVLRLAYVGDQNGIGETDRDKKRRKKKIGQQHRGLGCKSVELKSVGFKRWSEKDGRADEFRTTAAKKRGGGFSHREESGDWSGGPNAEQVGTY